MSPGFGATSANAKFSPSRHERQKLFLPKLSTNERGFDGHFGEYKLAELAVQ
jgi:hypothetical protein